MTNEHTLDSIGTFLEHDRERDAVHIAIIPVVAGEQLQPGQKVAMVDGKAMKSGHDVVGVVSPYLFRPAEPGERVWLFLWPQTITNMRHRWASPAFPEQGDPAPPEQIGESTRWLYKFADDHGANYDDLVQGAASGAGCTFIGHDQHGPLGNGEIDVDPVEFWRHVEVVTGCRFSRAHREGTYFGCSC